MINNILYKLYIFIYLFTGKKEEARKKKVNSLFNRELFENRRVNIMESEKAYAYYIFY